MYKHTGQHRYVHTDAHSNTNTHTHAHIYTKHSHAHVYSSTHPCEHMYNNTGTSAHTGPHVHTHIHLCAMHTGAHTHYHMYTVCTHFTHLRHTRTHVHTCTNTQGCAPSPDTFPRAVSEPLGCCPLSARYLPRPRASGARGSGWRAPAGGLGVCSPGARLAEGGGAGKGAFSEPCGPCTWPPCSPAVAVSWCVLARRGLWTELLPLSLPVAAMRSPMPMAPTEASLHGRCSSQLNFKHIPYFRQAVTCVTRWHATYFPGTVRIYFPAGIS